MRDKVRQRFQDIVQRTDVLLRVQNANSPFAFDTSAPGLPPVYTYTIYFNISIYERERESESKSERAREGGNEGRREGGKEGGE